MSVSIRGWCRATAATYIIGINGAEREIFSRDTHLGESVEEGTLSYIGKSHNSNLHRTQRKKPGEIDDVPFLGGRQFVKQGRQLHSNLQVTLESTQEGLGFGLLLFLGRHFSKSAINS